MPSSVLRLAVLVSCLIAMSVSEPATAFQDDDNTDASQIVLAIVKLDLPALKKRVSTAEVANTLLNTGVVTDRTPMHLAAEAQWIEGLQYLQQIGGDVNVTDSLGRSPLFGAVFAGADATIIRWLCEHGADLELRDQDGATVLHSAAQRGTVPTVNYLIETGADPTIEMKSGWTVLHSAASSYIGGEEAAKIVQCLLDKELDVNARDDVRRTPLHVASRFGNIEALQVLVENAADIRAVDVAGRDALHYAAIGVEWDTGSRVNLVDLLLEKGLSIGLSDHAGLTPLHFAAAAGQMTVARHLIEKRADVNAKTNRGDTPLHIAVRERQFELAKLLIHKSAEVDAANEAGEKPVDIARAHGDQVMVELLEK